MAFRRNSGLAVVAFSTIFLAGDAVLAGWSDAGTVRAATLTNRDTATHKVLAVSGQTRREHEIAPGATLRDVCKDGCVLQLNGKRTKEYRIEPKDTIVIEQGLVFFDTSPGVDVPLPPGPGGLR